jgi:hypothetical protein
MKNIICSSILYVLYRVKIAEQGYWLSTFPPPSLGTPCLHHHFVKLKIRPEANVNFYTLLEAKNSSTISCIEIDAKKYIYPPYLLLTSPHYIIHEYVVNAQQLN